MNSISEECLLDNIESIKRRINRIGDKIDDLNFEYRSLTNDIEALYDELFDAVIDDIDEAEEEKVSVYFMINSHRDMVKIGISNNVMSRLHSLETACGDDISLSHSFECTNRKEALKIESMLHKYYDFARVKPKNRGSKEWFKISEIVLACHYRDIIHFNHINSVEDVNNAVNYTELMRKKADKECSNKLEKLLGGGDADEIERNSNWV